MDDAVLDGSSTGRASLARFTHPVDGVAGIGWRLIALHGELDLCAAPLLAATLSASVSHLCPAASVVVDLTQVEFIDSSGLDALLRCRDQLRASSKDLVVRNPSPMFVRMIDIFGDTDLAEQSTDRRDCRLAC